MNLTHYMENEFSSDLKKLTFTKPNSVIQKDPSVFKVDSKTTFFGGHAWKNVKEDLKNIDPERRENFLLCLFTTTLIDLAAFMYYPVEYPVFREKTVFPKFGWVGFGPHFEEPQKLLQVPEQEGLVNFDETRKNIDVFIEFFVKSCKELFVDSHKSINTHTFISKIMTDKDFQLLPNEENTIVWLIHQKLSAFVKEEQQKDREWQQLRNWMES